MSPDGTLFIADLNNIRIRAVRANRPGPALSSPTFGGSGGARYEVASPREQELYVFNREGLHVQTISLVTGEPLYNLTYGPDGELASLVDNCNNTVKVRREGLGQGGGSGLLRLVLLPENQVVTLGLDPSGGLRSVSAVGQEVALMGYSGNTGLLATKADETGWTTFYQ